MESGGLEYINGQTLVKTMIKLKQAALVHN